MPLIVCIKNLLRFGVCQFCFFFWVSSEFIIDTEHVCSEDVICLRNWPCSISAEHCHIWYWCIIHKIQGTLCLLCILLSGTFCGKRLSFTCKFYSICTNMVWCDTFKANFLFLTVPLLQSKSCGFPHFIQGWECYCSSYN